MNKFKYTPNGNATIRNDDFYEVIEDFLREQNVNNFSLFEYTQNPSPSLLLQLFKKIFNKAGFSFGVDNNYNDVFIRKLNDFIECLDAPLTPFNRALFHFSHNINASSLRALAWLIQNRFEPILNDGKTSLRQRVKEEVFFVDLDFGKIGDYLSVHLNKEITAQGGFSFAQLDKQIQDRCRELQLTTGEDKRKLSEADHTKNTLKSQLPELSTNVSTLQTASFTIEEKLIELEETYQMFKGKVFTNMLDQEKRRYRRNCAKLMQLLNGPQMTQERDILAQSLTSVDNLNSDNIGAFQLDAPRSTFSSPSKLDLLQQQLTKDRPIMANFSSIKDEMSNIIGGSDLESWTKAMHEEIDLNQAKLNELEAARKPAKKPATRRALASRARDFISEPMGEKPATDLAGIGEVLGKRLTQKGYDKSSDLVLKKKEAQFIEWLKGETGANSKQALDCFKCLSEWCEQIL